MTDEDYFALDAVNASKLKAFRKAPILSQVTREETSSMRMGSLVHCAILEPELLEARYVITALDRRGTKAWEAEEQAAEGRELVKRGDYEAALRMRDSVWGNAYARDCLEGAETEMSATWTDPETGMFCKAKADAINRLSGYLIDVKTTTDAAPDEFPRQFARLGYWLQDVFYRAGFAQCGFGDDSSTDPTPFLFISVEKDTPNLVSVFEMDRNEHDKCRLELQRLMALYSECKESGVWPGYPAYNIIKLPVWA